MSSRIVRVAATVFLVLAVAACGDSAGDTTTTAAEQAPSGQAVSIDGFAFAPSSLTVPAGSTVTWSNEQGVAHTVTATDGSFDSGSLDQGDEFSQTFDAAGTFDYFCAIHPSMTGTVSVEG